MRLIGGSLQRDPALTYRGALQILGRHDRPRIERMDRLLGGFILGAGAAAGAAALLGPALVPLGALAAIWGWLEQKNEAISLLRKVLDGVSERLLGTGGYERYRLVAAAHTAMVAAAFFEALREHVGEDGYSSLAITEGERRSLALGHDVNNRNLVDLLYEAPVPAPSPARGYEENIPHIRTWMSDLTESTQGFLSGLASWQSVSRPLNGAFIDAAVDRYRSRYLTMAATVPEFLVWASLGEHAATRNRVTQVRKDVLAALDVQSSALARLESVLNLVAAGPAVERDICGVLHRANRGVLDESIISEAAMDTEVGVTFPAIGRIFLNTRYRLGMTGAESRPSDETWWQERQIRADLDLFLAGQVTAPDAAQAPLLLLGHPGAGKSLLTKVIAARLPASAFTVVRVPLRRVDADAPVYEQIQQALDAATHGRIDWWELAERSSATVRVVLLDGLDELLQAAGHRGGYLQDVVDFQRREAEQDRPVVVVVTSRTVVADRVAIPRGTTMLKLEGFDEAQIEKWLEIWNEVNSPAIASGAIRGLVLSTALRQPDLASQPLLLTMLAVYSADLASPAIDSDLSSADLYRRLLDNFIRREVAKSPYRYRADDFEEAVHDQLWRLSIAALAMFNRGRQDVTDVELGGDLAALGDTVPSTRAAELGQQLIGHFFFVYLAEARQFHSSDKHRCYEFLHATFGEYLLASYVVELLAEMTDALPTNRRGIRGPDDDLLYALLSHQPLAARKTTLVFAAQLVGELPRERRKRILSLLEALTANYRWRHSSDRYAGYKPIPVDRVRQLASYSANLILLRIMLDENPDEDDVGLQLSCVCPDNDNPMSFWHSMVMLWRSGLDSGGFQAILSMMSHDSGLVRRDENSVVTAEWTDLLQARLVGDKQTESRLRFGMAVRDQYLYRHRGDQWEEVLLSSLIPALSTQPNGPSAFILPLQPESSDEYNCYVWSMKQADIGIPSKPELYDMVIRLLILRSDQLPFDAVQAVVNWVLRFSLEGYEENHRISYGLASAIAAYPELLDVIPDLDNPDLYGDGVPLIFMMSPRCYDQRLRSLQQRIESHIFTDNTYGGGSRSYTIAELLDMMLKVKAAYRIDAFPLDVAQMHLALLCAETVVRTATTDVWETAKWRLAQLLSADRPRRARLMEHRLEITRDVLTDAPEQELEEDRTRYRTQWKARILDFLEEYPNKANDLRTLIDQIQAQLSEDTASETDSFVADGDEGTIAGAGEN